LEENREQWHSRLTTFFTDPEDIKRLSNRSVWENNQVKVKNAGGHVSLSSTLNDLASGTNVPKPLKTGLKQSLTTQNGASISATTVSAAAGSIGGGMTSSPSLNALASSLAVPKK